MYVERDEHVLKSCTQNKNGQRKKYNGERKTKLTVAPKI